MPRQLRAAQAGGGTGDRPLLPDARPDESEAADLIADARIAFDSSLGLSDFPAQRRANRARRNMSGNQAQRDAGGIFDIVLPLESRLRKDRLTRAQAFRHSHAGD